jgi:hypothetical protein
LVPSRLKNRFGAAMSEPLARSRSMGGSCSPSAAAAPTRMAIALARRPPDVIVVDDPAPDAREPSYADPGRGQTSSHSLRIAEACSSAAGVPS